MGFPARAARSVALAAATIASAALGAVFPIPPALLLTARRRIDRTELIRPAAEVVAIHPSEPVPSWLLDRSCRPDG